LGKLQERKKDGKGCLKGGKMLQNTKNKKTIRGAGPVDCRPHADPQERCFEALHCPGPVSFFANNNANVRQFYAVCLLDFYDAEG
jgi:hypothetical protein